MNTVHISSRILLMLGAAAAIVGGWWILVAINRLAIAVIYAGLWTIGVLVAARIPLALGFGYGRLTARGPSHGDRRRPGLARAAPGICRLPKDRPSPSQDQSNLALLAQIIEAPRRLWTDMRMTDLQPGWTVVANDGHRLGAIRDVGQHYVLVSRAGRLSDLFVPSSAIANVDDGVVYLNLAKREAEEMGWEQPPREEDPLETTPESDLHRHV